jgi:polyribonucleotide nucleotidyltransferase
MMDAGIPILRPVAGISIGMVSDGDRNILLTDIMGEEDHYGDMDFKVAGTQDGITGIQLDLKARGLPMPLIRETLDQAKRARLDILKAIVSVLDTPREEISTYAPQLVTVKIPVEMIGKIIGPGGKEIKRIQETTGAKLDIDDDGTVHISATSGDGHLQALDIIKIMTMRVEVGQRFKGKVVATKDFGAFIEIAPGSEGLCHISELSDGFVKSVADVCDIGDAFDVKVIAVDETGRIKLSRKAAIKEDEEKAASSV